MEDYQSDRSAAVAQAAVEAVTKLRHELADELRSESEAEAHGPAVPGPTVPGQAVPAPAVLGAGNAQPSLSLNQLSQATVQVLLNEILLRDQPLARLELIRRVSRRFGRDHLGHGVDTNQNVYTKVSLARRRQAVNLLDTALGVM